MIWEAAMKVYEIVMIAIAAVQLIIEITQLLFHIRNKDKE